MKRDFWQKRWDTDDIQFHRGEPHPMVLKYFKGAQPGKVFIPFCGKSEDLTWFSQNGWEVSGSELIPRACEDYFAEHQFTPSKVPFDGGVCYEHDRLKIWCGDHFTLPDRAFAGSTAWYDRGALVALPPDMRRRYIDVIKNHLPHFSKASFQMLLIGVEYDAPEIQGPPWNVTETEIRKGLESSFQIELLERYPDPTLNGRPRFENTSVFETVYRLRPLS